MPEDTDAMTLWPTVYLSKNSQEAFRWWGKVRLGVQQTLVELRESRYSPVHSHEGERNHAWVTTIDLPFTTIDWINTVTPFPFCFQRKKTELNIRMWSWRNSCTNSWCRIIQSWKKLKKKHLQNLTIQMSQCDITSITQVFVQIDCKDLKFTEKLIMIKSLQCAVYTGIKNPESFSH